MNNKKNKQITSIESLDLFIKTCKSEKERLQLELDKDKENQYLQNKITFIDKNIKATEELKIEYIEAKEKEIKKEKEKATKKLEKSKNHTFFGFNKSPYTNRFTNFVFYASLFTAVSTTYALKTNIVTPTFEPFIANVAITGAIVSGTGIIGKVISDKATEKKAKQNVRKR